MQGGRRQAPPPFYVLRGVGAAVNALVFHPMLPVLYVGSGAGDVAAWSLETLRPLREPRQVHTHAGVLHLELLSGGAVLLSHGRDGDVVSVDVDAASGVLGRELGRVATRSVTFCRATVLQQGPECLVLVPDEHETKTLVAWRMDVTASAPVLRLVPGRGRKTGMAMASACGPGSHTVLAGYESGDLVLWDTETGAWLHSVRVLQEAVLCIRLVPNTGGGMVSGADAAAAGFLVDQETMQLSKTQHALPLAAPGCGDIAVRRDGKLVALAGWDRRVRLYEAGSLRPLAILRHHSESVYAVAFASHQLGVIASGGKDQEIALWRVYPG